MSLSEIHQRQWARDNARAQAFRLQHGRGFVPSFGRSQGFPGGAADRSFGTPVVAPKPVAGPVVCRDLSKATVCDVMEGVIEWLKAFGARLAAGEVCDPRGEVAAQVAATVSNVEAIVKALDMVSTLSSPLDTALALLRAKNFGVTRKCFQAEDGKTTVECVICGAAPPCILLEPCMHVNLCETCIRDKRAQRQCCTCRNLIKCWQRVYLP